MAGTKSEKAQENLTAEILKEKPNTEQVVFLKTNSTVIDTDELEQIVAQYKKEVEADGAIYSGSPSDFLRSILIRVGTVRATRSGKPQGDQQHTLLSPPTARQSPARPNNVTAGVQPAETSPVTGARGPAPGATSTPSSLPPYLLQRRNSLYQEIGQAAGLSDSLIARPRSIAAEITQYRDFMPNPEKTTALLQAQKSLRNSIKDLHTQQAAAA